MTAETPTAAGQFGDQPAQDGFEFKGEFFIWHLSDTGKDLMLIDRLTNMPVDEFFATVQDEFDRGRAPILLGMIACSIRHKYPAWSVQRIVRMVENLSIGTDVSFVDDSAVEEADRPSPLEEQDTTSPFSDSTSDGQKGLSSQTEAGPSET